jgi:hypothetical protein
LLFLVFVYCLNREQIVVVQHQQVFCRVSHSTLYRSFLRVPQKTTGKLQLATLLCGSSGGRASCLRQDAHPPSFKKKDKGPRT